jgi:hypothetical protein
MARTATNAVTDNFLYLIIKTAPSLILFMHTIHETTTSIRKSSQQAVCRFCEASLLLMQEVVPVSQAAYSNKLSLMCKHNAQIYCNKLS